MQLSDARHGVSVSVCGWLEYCVDPYILCIDAQRATSCGGEMMTKFLADFMFPGLESANEIRKYANFDERGDARHVTNMPVYD